VEEQRKTRRTSTGECSFCHRAFGKGGMARHLGACPQRRAALEAAAAKPGAKREKLLHLMVTGRDQPDYWMHLEMPAKTTLEEFDEFLRDSWLECCGHLSAFNIAGETYLSTLWGDYREPGDRTMRYALGKVLSPGSSYLYEYDFGTTTELVVRVASGRVGFASDEGIVEIAVNLPPDIRCDSCGAAAIQVCSLCRWEDDGWLCDECAGDHECGEDYLLPVVNSPRVGMCGYTG
jgi:hypothetical protein